MACGSRRACWFRKESRPGIGAERETVSWRRRRSTTAAAVAESIFFGWGLGRPVERGRTESQSSRDVSPLTNQYMLR